VPSGGVTHFEDQALAKHAKRCFELVDTRAMIKIEQSPHLPRIAAESSASATWLSPAVRIASDSASLAAISGGSTAHAWPRFGRDGRGIGSPCAITRASR
jgi:hypothetical protein